MPDFAEPTRQPARSPTQRDPRARASAPSESRASPAAAVLRHRRRRAGPGRRASRTDVSATDKRLIVSNWPAYIDPRRDGPTNTRDVFEDQTGITVEYTDDVNDNAEFFAKVRNQLGACEPVERDMIMLTDWMAARMIDLGWIQPLDAAKMPNLHDEPDQAAARPAWDPDLTYHAPWQSGLTGIAYNAAETDEVGSASRTC